MSITRTKGKKITMSILKNEMLGTFCLMEKLANLPSRSLMIRFVSSMN